MGTAQQQLQVRQEGITVCACWSDHEERRLWIDHREDEAAALCGASEAMIAQGRGRHSVLRGFARPVPPVCPFLWLQRLVSH